MLWYGFWSVIAIGLGSFTADPAVIGFGNGIILSTGDIRNVKDQNSGTLAPQNAFGAPSHTDLISTINGTRRSFRRIASKISWMGNGENESKRRYPSS